MTYQADVSFSSRCTNVASASNVQSKLMSPRHVGTFIVAYPLRSAPPSPRTELVATWRFVQRKQVAVGKSDVLKGR